MSVSPLPSKSLEGHCSVIEDDTLYVFSPDSFQSLQLKENATWSTLPSGVSVTGSACTRAAPNGDDSQAALYVIGGTSDSSSYGGMQRYFFSNQTWETLTPLTNDMKGRTNHSIAYLNDTASIVVYAGSQPNDDTTLSSQTFLISVDAPYQIDSFTSDAPPTTEPILAPWNSSHAVMVGGIEDNLRIFTFGPSEGWKALDTNLTSGIATGARGIVVSGSDGSKVLEVYDASVSPNEVQQLVLLGVGGTAASNGETVSSSSSSKRSSSRKRKRDLTLSNWPSYNSTGAPTATRSDYSVAQNSNGLAVLSGGNTDNPINIYNMSTSSWISNDAFFGASADQVPLASSTSSATSSSTASSTSSAASSTATTGPASTSKHTLRTLGIILGVLGGVALLFIAALIYMRRRKQRRKQQPGEIDEKENADRLSFADRGASFMKEAGGSIPDYDRSGQTSKSHFHQANQSTSSLAIFGAKHDTGYKYNNKDMTGPAAGTGMPPPSNIFHDGMKNSHSSLAIIAGKFGNHHNRNVGEKGSFESTARLVRSPSTDAGHEQALEMDELSEKTSSPTGIRHSLVRAQTGEVDQSTVQVKKRSSGWSKYFAPDDAGHYQQNNNLSTLSMPQYSTSRNASALVPPLDVEMQKAVTQGRPSFGHSASDLASRGSSLDVTRGQTAAFHTGESLEPVPYLDPNRKSFGSQHRHSLDSSSSRASSQFFSNHNGADSTSAWTPVSQGILAQPVHSTSSSTIKQINVSPSLSPRVGHLQREESSSLGFPRPPSSTYSASIAPGRDSGATPEDGPGRALSPPVVGPTTITVPGSAARAGGAAAAAAQKGSSTFFPGSGNRDIRLAPRKLGSLHPGTLAAISGSGISPTSLEFGQIKKINPDGGDRDSGASNMTAWPATDDGPSQRFLEERERLNREKEAKIKESLRREQQSQAGGKNGEDMSWLNLEGATK